MLCIAEVIFRGWSQMGRRRLWRATDERPPRGPRWRGVALGVTAVGDGCDGENEMHDEGKSGRDGALVGLREACAQKESCHSWVMPAGWRTAAAGGCSRTAGRGLVLFCRGPDGIGRSGAAIQRRRDTRWRCIVGRRRVVATK